jgi:hypothetical protein
MEIVKNDLKIAVNTLMFIRVLAAKNIEDKLNTK